MNRITGTAVRFLSFVMLAALLAPNARAVDATGGTITYTDSNGLNPRSSPAYPGGYKIHTFTYPGGTFDVLNVDVGNTVDYLVVGGGGAGGQRHGGGGGAGGLLTGIGFAVTAQPYAITVGAGGAAYVGTFDSLKAGGPGGNSVFATFTAVGGGGGRTRNGTHNGNGGSGGGGAGQGDNVGGTPTSGQGFPGGSGSNTADGSGGGGASAAGASGTSNGGGKGGDGVQSSISGVVPAPYYAGGGGGGGDFGDPGGAGGEGGGGHGGDNGSSVNMTAGEDGKGGGGGGMRENPTAADGGDGIVIIRYSFSPIMMGSVLIVR